MQNQTLKLEKRKLVQKSPKQSYVVVLIDLLSVRGCGGRGDAFISVEPRIEEMKEQHVQDQEADHPKDQDHHHLDQRRVASLIHAGTSEITVNTIFFSRL